MTLGTDQSAEKIGTLYGYWRSSCSWRVRLALAYKGLEVHHHPIHLVKNGGEQFQEDYTQHNLMQQVPLLILQDGTVLSQSIAILEFLEEAYPNPKLLPSNSIERAKVRQIVEIINSGIQPLQNLSLLNYFADNHLDQMAFAKKSIEKGLRSIAQLLPKSNGPFLLGETITFAECCLIPQLYNAKRFNCDLAGLERLLQVESRCQLLECFQVAHPNNQPDAQIDAQ